ncbi:unnamed protein product [Triticum turgidum subsp. durum]|uniref:TLC domain-containing protein n=1 Tax=Triticum turgidum subsp. durum TaxID=4567 RepID=A0A9R0R387_TRITD|nr:unnamed protein product [Triticum turgidum subsp. durum]
MDVPAAPAMAFKAYMYKEVLVRDYLLADSYAPYTAVLGGILMCKLAYDFTRIISSFNFKGYASLNNMQKIEWNNRGMSTVHAIFITVMSVYLVFFSGMFSDQLDGPVTVRSSSLSSFTLGVSIGYFITDIAMIYWLYPALGGMEYVIHHMLSLMSTMYAMLSGEAHVYIYMGLITETTTPGINLRWFLDVAGMKNSKAYLVNGVAMVITWLVARIILFMYLFYHMFVHYDQIKKMNTFGYFLVLTAPCIIFVMNVLWFSKILKGLKKTMAKRHAE